MESDPTILDFACVCNSTLYEGTRCQTPIDYCLNETCSGNGVCQSVNGVAQCTCTSLYYGQHCEIETNTVTQSEQVKKAATAITIVGIATIYLICIIFDVLRFRFNVI